MTTTKMQMKTNFTWNMEIIASIRTIRPRSRINNMLYTIQCTMWSPIAVKSQFSSTSFLSFANLQNEICVNKLFIRSVLIGVNLLLLCFFFFLFHEAREITLFYCFVWSVITRYANTAQTTNTTNKKVYLELYVP